MKDVQPKYRASVKKSSLITPEVMQVTMELEDKGYQFQSGQYLTIFIDNESRPFSIASSPDQLPLLEFQIRKQDDNPFTCQLLELISKRKPLMVSEPMGDCHFPAKLNLSGPNQWVFIAGGTGFAPIQSIVSTMIQNQCEATFHLFWGVEKATDLFAEQQLIQWQKQYSHFKYHPVINDPHDQWTGLTGLVHKAAMTQLDLPLSSYQYLLAGSAQMIEAVHADLVQSGVDPIQIHGDMVDILELNP